MRCASKRGSRSWAWLLVVAVGLPGAAALAESFPPVEKLPARAELPDPFVTLNGERVTTKEQWVAKRRPELKALFQHYMYGNFPPAPEKVLAQVEHANPKFLDGKAVLREVRLSFPAPDLPPIHLLLVVPSGARGPVPVFLGLNFSGNHSLVDDPGVRLPTAWMYSQYASGKDGRAVEANRGKNRDTWAIDQSIARGYAVATFYNGDIDPDKPDFSDGLHAAFLGKEKMELGPTDFGTIAAWAWGLHRAVDYLVTLPEIDAKRIAVVGHSRLGKTALLAAAYDERIALAVPSQAGCGGTAPSRGKVGESVKQINDRFPHWFTGNFKRFNEQPEKLPFDQHCLVALVAPRPVLFPNAVEDTWANPDGQFQVLQAADPVYRLLGAGGLDAKQPPEAGALLDSRLGYYIRPGKHSMTREDWKVFLDFADKHLGK